MFHPLKVLSWIIALLGLWEFGDIAALFVPGFGDIPVFVWNHIIVGLLLIIAGARAAWTGNIGAAKTMYWIAVVAGVWLMIGSLILRPAASTIGSWNDFIVGVIVVFLGLWAVLTSPRVTG